MSQDFQPHQWLRARRRRPARKHRSILFVELVTTAALALSTAVAVTAVSIGMARADVHRLGHARRRRVAGDRDLHGHCCFRGWAGSPLSWRAAS